MYRTEKNALPNPAFMDQPKDDIFGAPNSNDKNSAKLLFLEFCFWMGLFNMTRVKRNINFFAHLIPTEG